MPKRKMSLSYIEDTKKHHRELQKLATSAGKKAVARARARGLHLTYLEGQNIIRESPDGKKEVIGRLTRRARRVKKGSKLTLSV